MRVLITGGAGFIGSHIVEELLRSNYEVIVIDNLITGKKDYVPAGVRFYESDICNALDTIFTTEQPDIVIHQAAQVSVSKSMDNPYFDGNENVLATINLLQASVKYKVKKFIFASTAAIYGNPQYLPIDEGHGIQPISFYGLSKNTAEQYIELFSNLYNLPYVILRYSNVYGSRQNSDGEAGVIANFINKVLNNQEPIIFGDGKQTRDFVFVKDVARANVLAIDNGYNEKFNISTNKQTSLLQILSELKLLLNHVITPKFCGAKEGDIIDSFLTNGKSKLLLQWDPIYTISSGLKETVAFYKDITNQIKLGG